MHDAAPARKPVVDSRVDSVGERAVNRDARKSVGIEEARHRRSKPMDRQILAAE